MSENIFQCTEMFALRNLFLNPRPAQIQCVAGIKHRNRTPRVRSIQTKGKGRVKPFRRMILDTLIDWQKPEEPRPLWETCDRRFYDPTLEENPPLHPYEQIQVQQLLDQLSTAKMAVAFFNLNMSEETREVYFYKFRYHGFSFISRPFRIFEHALRDTKFVNMTSLLTGVMPILVLSESEENVKDLFKLVRNDSNLLMLGGFYSDRLLSLKGLEEASKSKDLNSLRAETVAITQSQSSSLLMALQQQQMLLCKQLEQITNLDVLKKA